MGQRGFTTNDGPFAPTAANTLFGPTGIVIDPQSGRLFVADMGNARVLSWPNRAARANGGSADLVFGKPDFKTYFYAAAPGLNLIKPAGLAKGGVSAMSLNYPMGIAIDGKGALYVADSDNHRVLRFADPLHTAQVADLVYGQSGSFTQNQPNAGQLTRQAGAGNRDCTGLDQPNGVGVTADGDLFGCHALYFHQVGTPQRQDRCVFYHAAQPAWYYQPTVSPDGRWLALTILNHSACNRLTLMALTDQSGAAEGPPIAIIPHFTGHYTILHWQPDQLILRATEADVPHGRLLAVALGAQVELRSTLPQPPLSRLPLLDAAPMGDGWVLHYLRGACAELQLYAGRGAPGVGSLFAPPQYQARMPLSGHADQHPRT